MVQHVLREAARLSRRSRGALRPVAPLVRRVATIADDGSLVVPDGGAPPAFRGAYCEGAEVSLGRDKVPVAFGFETGRIARLANGAVMASMGDTRVMCAAVTAREPDPNASFFNLNVEYRERASAWGKIPGTFTRREGPYKDREVLAMRVVDRALRPLFPKAFKNETSVQAIVLSTDRSQDPAVLAVNGASAALAVSDIPWDGPVGAVRVAVVDGEIVLHPSDDDVEASDFTLTYAGNERRAMMIEAAAMKARGAPEATVAAALRAAHEAAREMIAPQLRLREVMGREKRETPAEETGTSAALRVAVLDAARESLRGIYDERIQSKSERGRRMAELKEKIAVDFAASDAVPGHTAEQLDAAFLHASSRVMRDLIFDERRRVDGRGLAELRDLDAEVAVMPVVHGSSLFGRGNTQALSTVTIGSLNDVQRLDAPVGPENKRLMLHYSFPSFSINETPRRGGLSRREIGHGALAEKSLASMLPPAEEWPFAVRVNAETMESNGSSSMAAVCSGSMALMDAGVPIGEHVGAISVGLVMDEDEDGNVTRHALLSDLMGLEDVLGDMDFKIAGTRSGVTGIQLDCKPAGIPLDILVEALEASVEARNKVIDAMERAIPVARDAENLPESAPRHANTTIDLSLVGKLIGRAGENVKDIEATTGAKISIGGEQEAADGVVPVGVFAPNKAALEAALARVELVKYVLRAGDTVRVRVTDVKPFGWIARTEQGDEGMLHWSEFDWTADRVDTAEHLPVGSELEVKVLEAGERSTKFSKKALVPPPPGASTLPRPRTPLGRGAGKSAGRGGAGGFVRNPDGTLKRPLERVEKKTAAAE